MKNKICLYSYPYASVDSYYKMIDLAAELGLRGVEGFNVCEFAQPDLEEAKKLRDYADQMNVVFPCFSAEANLVWDQAAESEAKLMKYAEVCAALGSPYLHHTVIPYCRNRDWVLENAEAMYQKCIPAVRRVAEYAASLGVKTVFEDQGYIINGCKGFSRFLADVKADVGVVADFGNIFQVDEKPEDFINAFSDRICHVHIKDAMYVTNGAYPEKWITTLADGGFYSGLPGKGVVDFQKCFSKLKKSGYRGWYGLEFNVGEGGNAALRHYIGQLEQWYEGNE